MFLSVALIAVFVFLNACRKEDKTGMLRVTIFEPTENSTFVSPGWFHVHIIVEAEQPLRAVQLNITNDDFIPIFGHVSFQPAGNTFEKAFDFQIEKKSVNPDASYYFHVLAQGFNGTKNKYQKIRLTNTPVHFKGALLFTENSNGHTTVLLYKNQTDTLLMQRSGKHLQSEYSMDKGAFYLLQSQAPMLSAYAFGNLHLQWNYSSETTESLSVLTIDPKENTIYSGLSGGSVYGFNMNTGVVVFTAPFMHDTVPQHLAVTKDFLFGEFKTRLKNHKVWISFYKKSGVILHRQPASDSTVMIFPDDVENAVSLVRNRNNGAYFVQYDVSTNTVLSTRKIAEGRALAVCKTDEGTYLLATSNGLFRFNKDFIETVNCTPQTPILSMAYDSLNNTLFLMEKHRLTKWEWPKCKLVEEQYSQATFTDIQLIDSYEKK